MNLPQLPAARSRALRAWHDMWSHLPWWLSSVLFVSLVIKLIVAVLRGSDGSLPNFVGVADNVATIGLIVPLAYLLVRLVLLAKRRLLWRVRRKLILSYIFIGFVPALLIVAFFAVGGWLMFVNIASFLITNGVRSLVDEARIIATGTAAEIQRLSTPNEIRDVLVRREGILRARHPSAALAFVPLRGNLAPSAVGPWSHAEAPATIPKWVMEEKGFAGLIAYSAGGVQDVAVRVASLAEETLPRFAIIVDLPLDRMGKQRLLEQTGVAVGKVALGRQNRNEIRPRLQMPGSTPATPTSPGGDFSWVATENYADWQTGKTDQALLSIGVRVADVYQRLSAAQQVGNVALGQIALFVLIGIGLLFLIIQFVALLMGLGLARSITGSVHELFVGTERVRHGDFTHKIRISAHDQLGELATSFNSMTASIEELLRQSAEKKRLEEELRIARSIQMSLLPQGTFSRPGLALTALCVPAREVGGDYYDILPLDEDRLGLLIADVSGKGTSAALYMAELKGLMLSLSRIYDSPRRLLIEANQIISETLDSRSFITMTYAVVDVRARMMSYARAGHNPLIYLPSGDGGSRGAVVLAPKGLGLGIDRGENFERIIEEAHQPLQSGDVLLFFTDGLTEAMNEQSDLFGEPRLRLLVEQNGHLPSDELRELILREIGRFVGAAAQQDDMTMILLKVEDVPVRSEHAAEVAVAES